MRIYPEGARLVRVTWMGTGCFLLVAAILPAHCLTIVDETKSAQGADLPPIRFLNF